MYEGLIHTREGAHGFVDEMNRRKDQLARVLIVCYWTGFFLHGIVHSARIALNIKIEISP